MKFVTDGGGNRFGRLRPLIKGNTEFWKCIECNKRQIEFRSCRHRNTRPRCKNCGGIVYPVHEFVFAEKPPKLCKKCKKPLRMGNRTGVCSPCFDGMDYFARSRVLLSGSKNR